MSRELVIKIHCDFCSKDVPEDEAQSGELRLGGKFYEIDLCADCAPSLTTKLTPMPSSQTAIKAPVASTRQSKRYKATPKSERNLPCEICGKPCKNALGIRFHMVKMHPEAAAAQGIK